MLTPSIEDRLLDLLENLGGIAPIGPGGRRRDALLRMPRTGRRTPRSDRCSEGSRRDHGCWRGGGDQDSERPLSGDPEDERSPGPVLKAAVMSYRDLRFHARGGLGEVYAGYDEALRRNVAVKLLQQRRAHSTESRRRFVNEAEITAGLEHLGRADLCGRQGRRRPPLLLDEVHSRRDVPGSDRSVSTRRTGTPTTRANTGSLSENC